MPPWTWFEARTHSLVQLIPKEPSSLLQVLSIAPYFSLQPSIPTTGEWHFPLPLWGDAVRKYSSYFGKGSFEDGDPFWGVLQSGPALTGPGTRKNFSLWKGSWHCPSTTAEETFQGPNFSDTGEYVTHLVNLSRFQRDRKGTANIYIRSSSLLAGTDAETSSYSTEQARGSAALSLGNKFEEVPFVFQKRTGSQGYSRR